MSADISLSKGPLTPDQLDPIHAATAQMLVAAATGKIDLNLIARQELANRGYDREGVWVGFEAAKARYREEQVASAEGINA